MKHREHFESKKSENFISKSKKSHEEAKLKKYPHRYSDDVLIYECAEQHKYNFISYSLLAFPFEKYNNERNLLKFILNETNGISFEFLSLFLNLSSNLF